MSSFFAKIRSGAVGVPFPCRWCDEAYLGLANCNGALVDRWLVREDVDCRPYTDAGFHIGSGPVIGIDADKKRSQCTTANPLGKASDERGTAAG
jgi:hypothetical protein